jgi:hypothetical protein
MIQLVSFSSSRDRNDKNNNSYINVSVCSMHMYKWRAGQMCSVLGLKVHCGNPDELYTVQAVCRSAKTNL